jgi:DNA-binding YbaB/EbfC family protein
MSCKGIVHSVEIDPSLMQPSEKEMLEDLIKAAMNDARKKADDTTESETKRIMKDMGLPAGMGLPF